jgi:hypothetical protein
MVAFREISTFQPYLLAGERVLWTGRPKQGLSVSRRDAFLIPFSLFFAGFVVFWNVGVWTFPDTGTSADWFMKLWGVPFIVASLYIVIGRFFHDAAIRRNLHYAVTNQRVLLLRRRGSTKLSSLDLRQLPMLELSEHGDGTGTIAFDTTNESPFSFGRSNGFDWWVPSLGPSLQFIRIDNPRNVYEIIRREAYG